MILLLILTLLPKLTFYLIARGFHRTFATGAACQQRTLTPPDTWSCPTLGLASVLMLRPISPELVLFLDFWVSNIPRYFCFCFSINFFNFCWWRIPLSMTPLQRIGVHWLYVKKPELENKSLSKKMDRWIILLLNIVSLLTNNDNSWSTFPICNRFRWHEYKIRFSTGEWLNKSRVTYCTPLAESF